MNLTDIDLTRATPIEFDDIREGDTFVYADDCEVVIANAVRKGATMVGGGWIATGPHEEDRHFYADPEAYWFLLDRPSPRVEPGTTGTATVNGHRERVMRLTDDPGDTWVNLDGQTWDDSSVTDFVADPAPGIPQALRNTLEALDRYIRDGAPTADVIDEVYRVVGAYREARDV